MLEANSMPFPSNVVREYPGHTPGTARKPKLLQGPREALRSRDYSPRTEQTFFPWVKGFIYFYSVRHPTQMAEPEINPFLTYLAAQEKEGLPLSISFLINYTASLLKRKQTCLIHPQQAGYLLIAAGLDLCR